jgi:hypothetical protein
MGAKQQLLFDIFVKRKEETWCNHEYILGSAKICEVLMRWING